ncbi:MAG: electron transfer flavoprotein subunit alpha/FixB family protein [Planctomycetes bacterium]|nr:electron transfer flavoprotein subunit alpha/FixB family protein [Planctomycetota bacterium]
MTTIAVIAEARSGHLKKPSLEAVTAAKELAEKAGGATVTALIVGSGLGAAKQELAASGADHVVAIDSEALANYSGDGYAKVLVDALKELAPAAILAAHSAMGRDLAPRIAAALDTGLVSDATALHFEGGKYGATKPVFAGKAYKKSMFDSQPFMATIRPNNWEAHTGGSADVKDASTSLSAGDLKAVVKELIAAATDRVPLQEASVVVAGGRGLKGPEHFHLVEELAAAFGPGVAAVGASRAVVDAGWREHREQVGQTGKVVSPTLYIAIGISGAIQHLAGMRTSRYIVAINKDANAPIFKEADWGIVGDAFEVVPALTDAVKSAVG